MDIFEYDSYGHYVKSQTEANKIKIKWVYVNEKNISAYTKLKRDAKNVICHGSRNGAELKFFAKWYAKQGNKDVKILGTDISDTATQFKNTVQWDMMKPNPEWIGNWDVVYSNSFDHSFDPVGTLKVWGDQLTEDGILILEFSFHIKHQGTAREWDPIGNMSPKDMLECIEQAGLKIEKMFTTRHGPSNGKGKTYILRRN